MPKVAIRGSSTIKFELAAVEAVIVASKSVILLWVLYLGIGGGYGGFAVIFSFLGGPLFLAGLITVFGVMGSLV